MNFVYYVGSLPQTTSTMFGSSSTSSPYSACVPPLAHRATLGFPASQPPATPRLLGGIQTRMPHAVPSTFWPTARLPSSSCLSAPLQLVQLQTPIDTTNSVAIRMMLMTSAPRFQQQLQFGHVIPVKTNRSVRCRDCDITLNSPLQARQHFNGKAHQRRLQKLRDPRPEVTSQYQSVNEMSAVSESEPSTDNSASEPAHNDDEYAYKGDSLCSLIPGEAPNSPTDRRRRSTLDNDDEERPAKCFRSDVIDDDTRSADDTSTEMDGKSASPEFTSHDVTCQQEVITEVFVSDQSVPDVSDQSASSIRDNDRLQSGDVAMIEPEIGLSCDDNGDRNSNVNPLPSASVSSVLHFPSQLDHTLCRLPVVDCKSTAVALPSLLSIISPDISRFQIPIMPQLAANVENCLWPVQRHVTSCPVTRITRVCYCLESNSEDRMGLVRHPNSASLAEGNWMQPDDVMTTSLACKNAEIVRRPDPLPTPTSRDENINEAIAKLDPVSRAVYDNFLGNLATPRLKTRRRHHRISGRYTVSTEREKI